MERNHDVEMLKILDQFLVISRKYVQESVELLNGIHHTRMDNVEKQYFCFVRVVNAMTEKLSSWLDIAEKKGIEFRKKEEEVLPPTSSNVIPMPRKKRMLDLAD